jgi:hypothetical protein
MPSAEVPDIMPRTSMDDLLMERVHVIFTTEGADGTEKRSRRRAKRQ